MSNIISLNLDTFSVQYLCNRDKRLAKVIKMVGPINYTPHTEDAYAFLVHEIIEQMLSIKAGRKIYGRLQNLCGGTVNPTQINALSDDQIRSTGTSNSKVCYIRNLTNAVLNGTISIEKFNSFTDEEVIKSLTSIKGIGKWTAKMYLIFVLDRPDVLPFEDSAFLQVYQWVYKTNICTEKAVTEKCRKWKPYSSIASRFFYKALDAGMTKEEFHLYKQ